MLGSLIAFSLRHRLLVLAAALVLVAGGLAALVRLDIDAFPDTTPVQVQINAVAPALAPEEIELQVTARIEAAIGGVPGLTGIRSISKAGFSQVVAGFEEGTDVWFARQQLAERLVSVELPAGIERPRLGPVSSGLGEVFHYVVIGADPDPTRLRTVQEWVIEPPLRAVPGVAEVNSWGGFERRYEVRLDPRRLVKHELTLADVREALARNNAAAGGGSLPLDGQAVPVRGLGRLDSLEQIRRVAVASRDGVPIRIGDLAEVEIGGAPRQGAVTFAGRGEAVLGLGFMLLGQSGHAVTRGLKRRLEEVKPRLPAGVSVENVYDRTELVDHVIDTVRKNLFEGGLLVVAVLFVFLGHLRAGLIVAAAIPLSMLFAFAGMLKLGIAASLLSLGAIDFGLVVDSSLILVENVVRKLGAAPPGADRVAIVEAAANEVRGPTAFGELIIMLVYLPILALEGTEGKLFRPMALTVIMALAGSLVLSLTVMPVLASLVLTAAGEEREPLAVRALRAAYRPVLTFALGHRGAVLGVALGALALGGMAYRSLGWDFVPRMSEGAIAINVVRLAGTELGESVRLNTLMERAVLEAFPDEVDHVWSRIGTAEVATDPMGIEVSDLFVTLRPRERWKRARDQAELAEAMGEVLRVFPGQRLTFSQPIEMRMNELVSGVRADVAAKLFGDDFEELTARAEEIAAVLRRIPGVADLSVEQVTGQPTVALRLRPDALARHRVEAGLVLEVVEALAGTTVGEIQDGEMRFPLVLELAGNASRDLEALKAILIETPQGEHVPVGTLAEVERVQGPSTITREEGQRRITIQMNVRGRDVGGFVEAARAAVEEAVRLPEGGRYRVAWGGQFEHLERARRRLLVVVPLTLALILGLLYATYGRVLDALRVFTGVPFAAVGGVLALWAAGLPLSISAAVGFVALSGVAVLGDMILVSRVRQLVDEGRDLRAAVEEAAMTRVRPVVMTALVASLGFLPMATSRGVGAEVQRPLALVVIGGVVSSTMLTLLVLPALYLALARGRD